MATNYPPKQAGSSTKYSAYKGYTAEATYWADVSANKCTEHLAVKYYAESNPNTVVLTVDATGDLTNAFVEGSTTRSRALLDAIAAQRMASLSTEHKEIAQHFYELAKQSYRIPTVTELKSRLTVIDENKTKKDTDSEQVEVQKEYDKWTSEEAKQAELAKLDKKKGASQNSEDRKEPVITDPIKGKTAPNGKHYSENDVRYLIITEGLTFESAEQRLATEDKYKNPNDTQKGKDDDTAKTANTTSDKDSSSSSFTGSPSSGINLSSNADREANAKLAKEHPERVVDGVYYADDEALAAAKKVKEERLKQEQAVATAQAEAEAAKLAEAMKNIQKTLYGDNEEVVEQLTGTVGGVELNAVLGTAQSVRQRQRVLDYNKFKGDYKEPSSGKG